MNYVTGAKLPAKAESKLTDGNVPNANNADAIILAAWDRRVAAHDAYDALPFDDDPDYAMPGPGEDYNPDEKAQWAIIDAAEMEIATIDATGPAAIAVKLWTMLEHSQFTVRAECEALRRRDLSYFAAKEAELDFTHRLVISALRALKSLEA